MPAQVWPKLATMSRQSLSTVSQTIMPKASVLFTKCLCLSIEGVPHKAKTHLLPPEDAEYPAQRPLCDRLSVVVEYWPCFSRSWPVYTLHIFILQKKISIPLLSLWLPLQREYSWCCKQGLHTPPQCFCTQGPSSCLPWALWILRLSKC